ncbi:MAG: hypothetical protein IPM76_18595 [Chloroflexi bacterium]|nr:hypothetical protein [Chloroflexota bacterium]
MSYLNLSRINFAYVNLSPDRSPKRSTSTFWKACRLRQI